MAYVAVSGGQEAIEESIRLLHCMRGSTFKELYVNEFVDPNLPAALYARQYF